MNILCDYHHGELYESILKLFQDRLGATVYRPVGRDWHDDGYWWIRRNFDDTINQYLNFDTKSEVGNGIYLDDFKIPGYKDIFHRDAHKCITLSAAKEMKWDIIISTLFEHFIPFEGFIKKFCPGAKHILQLGNMVPYIPESAKNVLNSTCLNFKVPNQIRYHQEFNMTPLTWSRPKDSGKVLYCFLNVNYSQCGSRFLELESLMPDWKFREFGGQCRDGNIGPYEDQCNVMKEAGLIWHVKLNGDGYGYNLHRAFGLGRPVVINYSSFYRRHQLSLDGMMIPGKTIVDFDGKGNTQLIYEIKSMLDGWEEKSKYIYDKFRTIVNFDREFEKIKIFISNLL